MRASRRWLAVLILGIGCADETRPEPAPAPTPAKARTCKESATFVVLVHEGDFYRPATDPSDRVAQGGRYASAAIESCTEHGWSVEVRHCMAESGIHFDRSRFDDCLRMLEPKARVSLAAAFARIEAAIEAGTTPPGTSPTPISHRPWLAP